MNATVSENSVRVSEDSSTGMEAAGGGQWIGANVAAVESELTEVRKLGTFWPGSTGRPRTSLKPGGTPVRKLSLPGTLPRPAPCPGQAWESQGGVSNTPTGDRVSVLHP